MLAAVHAPTLVLHRSDDQVYSVAGGRFLAEHISGARFVELSGTDHLPWEGDTDLLVSEIDRFLRSVQDEEAEFDRVLATVMFTDIVGSTEMAVEKGNLRFADLLEVHHAAVRSELARYRGEEINTAGDGFLASFDGPARAIKCAEAIVKSLAALGISCRIGLHTGECEIRHGELQGIALHIAARVAGLAPPNGVFVSQTVKDLVAGSGIRFADAGLHALKGLPEKWRLHEVLSQ